MSLAFRIDATDGASRTGVLSLPHGDVPTPVFMPVGTLGAVKGVLYDRIAEMVISITLANTYHLYLRPGVEILEAAGGLHSFTGWKRPFLTDSGGFQVYSLSKLSKITDDGYEFASHIDGSRHRFTPESVYDLQRRFGSDIAMPLDECIAFGADASKVARSVDRTLAWARITRELMGRGGPDVFAIVQGEGLELERERCARELVAMDFPGYAIGGLSVGEEKTTLHRLAGFCSERLPEAKPRYLMGVGAPEDLVECVFRGVDMFDCVMATRNARNATVFTRDGKVHLRTSARSGESGPIEGDCSCLTCRNHSRSYLRHLFKADEMNGPILATIHNLAFFERLMGDLRAAIARGALGAFRTAFHARYGTLPTPIG